MVSFDYLYDTPEVLDNVYANINTENLIFLSSYNHIDDIYTLTQQAGLGYWLKNNRISSTLIVRYPWKLWGLGNVSKMFLIMFRSRLETFPSLQSVQG